MRKRQLASFALTILAGALLVVLAASPVTGQAVNGTLLGNVVDSSGAVVAGAKVTITEMKTGVGRGAETNGSGNYEFPDLPPGVYQVAVEQPGFKKETRADVEVPVNTTVRVNLRLTPGAVTETMVVTGELPLLQTDRADTGRKMETVQVAELPLGNNRNFQNLLNLVPGTVRAHREHSEFFNSQDSLSTEVNGQSREFNDLKLEGVDDNERTGLLQVYIPPAEAIQAVDVTTGNYSAEFGRAGGAVTNVQLKSGTNDFHGSVFEYNRISALAAVPFFQDTKVAPKGKTVYNYYGGTIGGPIFKNKLFFFGDFLRISDVRGKFDQFTLPTDAYRSGDLSSALASGVTIYDPFMTTDATHRTLVLDANGNPIPVAPAARTAFPGNIIPASRITALSQKIMALVPHSQQQLVGINYQFVSNFVKYTTAFDSKFDFNHTENDRYAFRFSRAVQSVNDGPVFGLAGGPKGGGFQGTGNQTEHSGALIHTHVFSPTLIVENRVGISHYRNIAQQSDYGSQAATNLGIKGANLNPFTSGLTEINVQGGFSGPLVGYSASLPWDRGETNINGVTNWTKIRGNHTFKFGLDLRRLRDDLVQSQDFNPRGVFRFGTGTTDNGVSSKTNQANNFAAFLIDAPTEAGRDLSFQSGSWRETEMFTFAQDTWQVNPRLTVNAGLRWELYFPPTPHHSGGFSNYDPTTNSLVLAGIGSNPLDLGRTMSYTYFAPRLGVAYRLTEKLVVRSGFGISYEPFTNNQYAWNFPVRQGNGASAINSHSIPTFDYGRGQEAASMAKGFPAPVTATIPANGIIVLPDRRLLPPGPAQAATHSGDSFNNISKNFRQPYIEAWNLAVQYALPKNFVVDAAYVGNHGVRVPMTYDLNAATVPGICQYANATSGCAATATPTTLMGDTCHIRPVCDQFGRTGASNFLFKRTTSNYNALQVKVDHKWSGGFLMTTSYTFSKALAFRSDDGSDTINGVTAQGFHRNYSVTSQDRRHILTQSFVYDLPFGKGKSWLKSGWASWLAGGWEISAVPTFMTGRPLHFTTSGSSLNASGTTQSPIEIAPFNMLGGIGKDQFGNKHLWFDTSAFCTPSPSPTAGCPAVPNGTLGNVARYAFAGPKFFNMDASISRRIPFTERVGLELKIEALNATNTPSFDLPTVDLTSSNYGLVTGTANGNRSVTLAGKITF